MIPNMIPVIEEQLREKDKEIERLKEENEFLKLSNSEMNLEHWRVVDENKRKIENLRKQNKRLNNIINELEKWLDEESEKTILSTGHLTCLMMCKNRLQELKGSGSNE